MESCLRSVLVREIILLFVLSRVGYQSVSPSHVMTIRRHPDPFPGELSSKIYENIRKFLEQCWECQQNASWEHQYIPLQRDFLCKSWYIIDSKIQNIAISRMDHVYLFFVSVWSLHFLRFQARDSKLSFSIFRTTFFQMRESLLQRVCELLRSLRVGPGYQWPCSKWLGTILIVVIFSSSTFLGTILKLVRPGLTGLLKVGTIQKST